jgi:hypothetical protein
LTNQDNFKDLTIDDEEFQEKSMENEPWTEHHVDELKDHMIPKVVVNLENLFDLKERFKGPKNARTNSSCPLHETVNIGTPKNPKLVNLDKTISKEERKTYLRLFRQNHDVFAWSYKDLKTYDTHIIQHTIPLKPKVKPFQKNL